MMIINRPKLVEKFVMLPNDMVFDDQLSCLARSILAELMARPPKWQTTADKMAEAAKRARGDRAESRRAFRMAFAELEEHGYILRKRTRVPKGQPGGGDFITILRVYAVPQNGHHEPLTGEVFMSEPLTHEWFMDEGSSVSTDEEDGSGKWPGQHSSTFAGAHVGQQAGDDLPDRLQQLYDAANRLSEDNLRRLLLAFESNRKTVYARARNKAIGHLDGKDPWIRKGPDGVRQVDLLSFKYGLQHYETKTSGLPAWLTTLPKQRSPRAAAPF